VTAIRGRAWVFGDDISTDVIHPPEFFSLDPGVVRRGLFRKLDPAIQPRLRPGDIIVAGRNFGCGSSRETCVQTLRLNEIGAVVAVDFARIFFRSATNLGLPCLTFTDPADLARITAGQELSLEPAAGLLAAGPGQPVRLNPPGPFNQRIWAAGGLLGLLPAEGAAGPAGPAAGR
jgi:3-isopropylmalate dehydratase small subunit